MNRRTDEHGGGRVRRVPAVAIASCVLVAAACGGGGGSIAKKPQGSMSSSVVASTTSTSPEATSTSAPATTSEPAPTTVADTVAATVPATPSIPAPSVPDHQGNGDTATGPPPAVVRPSAAWVGFGIPQPGSMFENMHEDHSLDGKGKFVALTFDDGPSQYTPEIVSILKFMGVPATFFQISNQSLAQQDTVKLMLAGGMHIGSHTKSHKHLAEVPPDVQADEVYGSIDLLNQAYGAGTVKCFRPPYAQYDQHVIDMAAERGTAMAMWSLDTLDWQQPSWQSMAARVVNGAKDRNVILMHDGGGNRTNTILALPWIIQGLRDKGFQFIQVC